MYESPKAERLFAESEDVLNTDFLALSNDQDEETDNTVDITDLLK